MQLTKFVTAVAVLFGWGFLYEKFISPTVMGSSLSAIPGLVTTPSMTWIFIGSLVGSAVFIWVYEKVQGSFGSGAKSGAMYGLYAGILCNFPLWLYFTLYVAWPYRAMWHFTLVNIVLTVINGAIVGLIYEKVGASKST